MKVQIKTNSKEVRPGDTFIAIKNVVRDGHDYINDAIKRGATKIIAEHGIYSVETEIVLDTKQYLYDYLYSNYYRYISDIKLIGITGTNGKTTTGMMFFQMLRNLGQKVGYLGTLGYYYEDTIEELPNTTPSIEKIYDILLRAKERGCKYFVMEVSSHAIAYNRIYGLKFDEVAFTNLTEDHLDFHKTMENYALTKQKLFSLTRNDCIAVINNDVKDWKDYFILKENHNVLIGQSGKDFKIENIVDRDSGMDFTLLTAEKKYSCHLNFSGHYNIYNYVMALALVYYLGFAIEDILASIDMIYLPKGRMEEYQFKGRKIFVDYAHTPDGIEQVLKALAPITKNNLVVIFGAGGQRDRDKRPIMGEIASRIADQVVITVDNSRDEEAEAIVADIIKGIDRSNYRVEMDRKKAIIDTLNQSQRGDIIAILGKSTETEIITKEGSYHHSDKEVVLEYIKEHG